MDKARLFGVIDRLHVTIEGLLAANADLTRVNQELLNASMAAMQDLSDIHRLSQATREAPQRTLADIHRRSAPMAGPEGGGETAA
jgi:hypothetical protein